jgi:hypothetical protein
MSATLLLLLGGIVGVGFLGSLFFEKTRIPDAVPLILIGLLPGGGSTSGFTTSSGRRDARCSLPPSPPGTAGHLPAAGKYVGMVLVFAGRGPGAQLPIHDSTWCSG